MFHDGDGDEVKVVVKVWSPFFPFVLSSRPRFVIKSEKGYCNLYLYSLHWSPFLSFCIFLTHSLSLFLQGWDFFIFFLPCYWLCLVLLSWATFRSHFTSFTAISLRHSSLAAIQYLIDYCHNKNPQQQQQQQQHCYCLSIALFQLWLLQSLKWFERHWTT